MGRELHHCATELGLFGTLGPRGLRVGPYGKVIRRASGVAPGNRGIVSLVGGVDMSRDTRHSGDRLDAGPSSVRLAVDVRRAVAPATLLLHLGGVAWHNGHRGPAGIPPIGSHHPIRVGRRGAVSRGSTRHRGGCVAVAVIARAPPTRLRSTCLGEWIPCAWREEAACGARSTGSRRLGDWRKVRISSSGSRRCLRPGHLGLEAEGSRRHGHGEAGRRCPRHACQRLNALPCGRSLPQARGRRIALHGSGQGHCVHGILLECGGYIVLLFVLVILLMLGIRIFQRARLGRHPGEVWRWLIRTLVRLRRVLLLLLVETRGPFSHHVLILESDHEVLHSGIPFPPDLNRV